MTKYQITIKNKGLKTHDFCLYAKKPEIANGGPDVFLTAMASQGAGPGGDVVFKFTHDLYAICGNGRLENGVSIEESVVATIAITLGQTGKPPVPGSTFGITVSKSVVQFSDPSPDASAGPGSFKIKTGHDFADEGSDIFAGISSKDPSGDGYTTNAVFGLDPGSTYTVQPHLIYYVATGSYTPGTLIDVTNLGDPCEISFEGTNSAKVEYTKNGSYTEPVYTTK